MEVCGQCTLERSTDLNMGNEMPLKASGGLREMTGSAVSLTSCERRLAVSTYRPGWWWCLWWRAERGRGSCCWRRWQPVSQSCRACGPAGCWWTPGFQSGPTAAGRSPRCRRSGSTRGGRCGTSCTRCCRPRRGGRPSPWGNATPGWLRSRSRWRSHCAGWTGHLCTARERHQQKEKKKENTPRKQLLNGSTTISV